MVELETSISREEKAAFEKLREEVIAHAPKLRLNARIVDELDVGLGFAQLAEEMKFVRPTVDTRSALSFFAYVLAILTRFDS